MWPGGLFDPLINLKFILDFNARCLFGPRSTCNLFFLLAAFISFPLAGALRAPTLVPPFFFDAADLVWSEFSL
jgi:hypothetical protein